MLSSTLLAAVGCATIAEHDPSDAQAPQSTGRSFPPGSFVENHGQWDSRVAFARRFPGATVWVERDALTVEFARAGAPTPDRVTRLAVRLAFFGARPAALAGEDPRPGTHNFFLGTDPTRWRSGVPGYAAVRYNALYPGVDLRVYEKNGALEYDLVLQPSADPEEIEVLVAGVDEVRVDPSGELVLVTRLGEIRQDPPTTWQVSPSGNGFPVPCRYELRSERSYGFRVERAEPGWPTTIDPGLDWSTFLGGSLYENGFAVAYDPSGAVVVIGETGSSDFPVTPGAFDTTYNGRGAPSQDVFVSKIAADGRSFVFSTYLGGSDGDIPRAVAVDRSGRVTVGGVTAAANFPTTPGAWQSVLNGRSDAFVARLSADGSVLESSTLVGGSSGDVLRGVAVADSGEATVVGVTSSSDFPRTAGTFGTPSRGSSDIFVTRVRADGTGPVFSTLIGGGNGEVAHAVRLSADGASTVTGVTSSADFPTTPGAYDRTADGSSDSFVLRLDATATSLEFSTLLGGGSGDVAESLALEASGATVVVGTTASSDFPTTPGAFDSTPSGSSDAFVTKLGPDGSGLVFSTLIGGGSGDVAKGVYLGQSGAVVVGGQTSSGDFPTTPGAVQTTARGPSDGFVTQLDPAGTALLYSTYLGGSGSDGGEGLAGDGAFKAALAGSTNSADYPTTAGAVQGSMRGTNDAFAARIDISTCGFANYGGSTPACSGPIAIGVSRCPRAGETAFGVVCTNAPPNASGLLGFGLLPDPVGFPLLGIRLHLSVSIPILAIPTSADVSGHAVVGLPLTTVVAGARAYFQFVWVNPASCSGTVGPLSASNALEIVVQ